MYEIIGLRGMVDMKRERLAELNVEVCTLARVGIRWRYRITANNTYCGRTTVR